MEEPVHEVEVKAVVYELKGARQDEAVELRGENSNVPVEIDSIAVPAEPTRHGNETRAGPDAPNPSEGGNQQK